MKYYLCKFSDNWADEMDLEGFCLMTEDERSEMIRDIKKRFKNGGSICFGTNEDNEYGNAEDVLATLSYKLISKDEYDVIRRTIGDSFGEQGPMDGSGGNWDEEDEDEERYCDECGDELNEDESDICDSCNENLEEDEDDDEEYGNGINSHLLKYYDERVNSVVNSIKKTFGIELRENTDYAASFMWKPTPKSELSIIIEKNTSNLKSQKILLNLKHDNNNVKNESLYFEDYHRYQTRLVEKIKEFVDKAKQYYNV